MASSSSPAPFFGIKDEEQHNQMNPQLPQSTAAPISSTAAGQKKKKRNLPGTPYPDAEVIALSPKSLLATNRFVCEVCNKGFQREQNLQLHRRGHNLPWKLRQKIPGDVRRRVYLCPEPTCVHHDPSRALGDLTGVKKHFCRKHGEKKWKCDKCSKRYAVQSDWKAHSKTCGTREYRCDCGTIFSRRDSFITHRAFCDALTQENSRLPTSMTTMRSNLYGNSSTSLGLSQLSSQLNSLQDQTTTHPSADLLRLGTAGNGIPSHLDSAFRQPPPPPPSAAFFLGVSSQNDHYNGEAQAHHHSLLHSKPLFHGLMQFPDFQSDTTTPSSSNLFNLGFFSNTSGASSNAIATNQNNHLLMHGNLVTDQIGGGYSLYNNSIQNDHSMLPQMSATALLQKAVEMGATTSGRSSLLRDYVNSSSGGDQTHMESETSMQNLMNSITNGSSNIFGGFDPGFCNMDEIKFQNSIPAASFKGSDGLTRDFLGVGREQISHGMEMSSLDPEMKPAQMNTSFTGGRLL
ncbi:protein indeterminate-domain 5, chloroplastic-like [Typha angustifolia]|uniref:protein indeterminate-domain 5, chloroplastic-like n=1 Tax=Typha angustifolia TaxID=59011 RepID=UPI003C2AED34